MVNLTELNDSIELEWGPITYIIEKNLFYEMAKKFPHKVPGCTPGDMKWNVLRAAFEKVEEKRKIYERRVTLKREHFPEDQ